MESNAVADGNIVADDAGIVISYMEAAVILNIAVAADNDFIYIAADSDIGPYAGILLQLYITQQSCGAEGIRLRVDDRVLTLELINIMLGILLFNLDVFHIITQPFL